MKLIIDVYGLHWSVFLSWKCRVEWLSIRPVADARVSTPVFYGSLRRLSFALCPRCSTCAWWLMKLWMYVKSIWKWMRKMIALLINF